MTETPEEAAEKLRLIDAWKQSIDVQKHFNELSLKIRNTATTVMGAGLAATGLIINENYQLIVSLFYFIPLIVSVCYAVTTIHLPKLLLFRRNSTTVSIKWSVLFHSLIVFSIFLAIVYFLIQEVGLPKVLEVNLGGITLFAVAIVMCIFYLLDRYWYHQLLKGTIEHAKGVETRLKQLGVNNYDIGEKIGIASPVKIGIATLHSKNKLDLVYLPIIFIFLFVSVMLMVFGSSIIGKAPVTVAALNTEISELKNQNRTTELILKSRIDSVRSVYEARLDYMELMWKSKSDSINAEFTNYRLLHSKDAADSLRHIIPSVLGKNIKY
jgi:hypothetical protein